MPREVDARGVYSLASASQVLLPHSNTSHEKDTRIFSIDQSLSQLIDIKRLGECARSKTGRKAVRSKSVGIKGGSGLSFG